MNIKKLNEIRMKKAHDHTLRNRGEIERSEKCGCMSCCRIFHPSEVAFFDSEGTGWCPYCGIDALIGDASGIPFDKKFLQDLNKRWF